LKARKLRKAVTVGETTTTLQWGRAVEGAETTLPVTKLTVEPGFNRAAPLKARKLRDHRQRERKAQAASMGPRR